jgi:putative hemolysin
VTLLLGAILMLAALLIRSGYGVLRGSSRIRLRHIVEEEAPGAVSAASYLDDPERCRAVLHSGESALAVGGAMLLASAAVATMNLPLFIMAAALAALIFAALSMVAGIVARSWSALMLAPSLLFLVPLSRLTVALPGLRMAVEPDASGATALERQRIADRENVVEVIKEGLREGIGDREDMKLVTRVMELRDRRVKDVMVPRQEIFALSEDLAPGEIARRIADSGYSRVPMYRGDLDHVVGIFHVLDVLKSGAKELPPLRPVVTASAAERCVDLLSRMLRQQSHICIVADVAAKTVGVVALEDLLEEMVGEIRDEYDEPAPSSEARVGP